MPSNTEIANLAISHLGVAKDIGNLDTENSNEARACRRFYELALECVLRDYPWSFASKYAALALIEEDPNSEWAYSYQLPSDCLFFVRILSGVVPENQDSRVPYKIGQSDSGPIIFTNQENAECEFTVMVDDASQYPPDFTEALSLRLAAYIAPRLTAGDPFKLGDRAMALYRSQIAKAQSKSANEEQPDKNPDSEFVRARE